MERKGKLILLILANIIILAFIAFGAWWYIDHRQTPAPSLAPSGAVLEYSTGRYGVYFRYNASWKPYFEYGEEADPYMMLSFDITAYDPVPQPSPYIYVKPNRTVAEEALLLKNNQYTVLYSQTETTVASQPATVFQYEQQGWQFEKTIIQKDGWLYEFNYLQTDSAMIALLDSLRFTTPDLYAPGYIPPIAVTNTETNQNTNTSSNTSDFIYYFHQDTPWENYSMYYGDNVLYHYLSSTERVVFDPGFNTAGYNMKATPYGLVFWKKGEQKETEIPDFQGPITYEVGVSAPLQFYDFATQKNYELPTINFQEYSATQYEAIYDIIFSVTEKKLLVEVGQYNVLSQSFEPGLVGGQPVKTYGVVINLENRTVETGDPLSVYLRNVGVSTTLFSLLSWDSVSNRIIATHGGEGCGAYDYLTYVDLQKNVFQSIKNTDQYAFNEENGCNPKSAMSSDNSWIVLYGKSITGDYNFYFFQPAKGPTPVRYLRGVKITDNPQNGTDYIKRWDGDAIIMQSGTALSLADAIVVSEEEFTPPVEESSDYAFDSCKGLKAYASYSWYGKIIDALNKQDVDIDSLNTDACLSLDKDNLILLVSDTTACSGIDVYKYNVKYASDWISEADSFSFGQSCLPHATEFGKRNGDAITITPVGCPEGYVYQYYYAINNWVASKGADQCTK